jgi:hypothetical protein
MIAFQRRKRRLALLLFAKRLSYFTVVPLLLQVRWASTREPDHVDPRDTTQHHRIGAPCASHSL